jgi:predicted aspartyl protease
MIRFRLAAALLALAAVPAFAQDAPRHHGPTPDQVRPARTTVAAPVEVPMGSMAGRPTIDVMIDGKGPFRFLVDTGAGTTVINQDLAQELGLAVLDSTRIGDPMNPNAIKAEVVQVPTMTIGDAKFETFTAASWDRGSLIRAGETNPPRGVIGFPVFRDVLLTFDYVDKKMTIAPGSLPKPDGKSVIPYNAPMGIPEFTVNVGGVEVTTHLDTGSGGFYSVPKRYQGQLKFKGPLEEVGRARTVNTEMILKGAELDGKLALGQFAWEKPFVIVSDELPMGNLGGQALASFAITFDQRAQAMKFEQKAPLVSGRPTPRTSQVAQAVNASGPAPPASGLRFGSHGGPGDLFVYDVAPDSPAAKAGVTAGEKVLEVNGTPFASMPEDQVKSAMRTSPLKLKLMKDGAAHEVTIVFP